MVIQEAILLLTTKPSFNHLPQIYPDEIYHLKEDQINALTSVNKEFIKNKLIGSTELISFQSFDGLTINGMMIKPDDFDPNKKYPL